MREPADSDRSLIDLARSALFEITEAETVGAVAGLVDDADGVIEVLFVSTMSGYPGWRWNVSLSTLDGDAPSVLETDLVPGEGALLAPDWVPWADRMADYRAAQVDAAGEDSESDEDDEDESDLLDSDDEEIDGLDFEDDDDDDDSDVDDIVGDGEPEAHSGREAQS